MANLPLSSFPSSPPLLFLLSTGRPFALPRGTRIHIHIHVCTCAGTNTSPPTEMAVELCRVVAEVVAHAPTPGPSNSTTSNIAIPSSSRRLLLAAFHVYSITLHAHHDIYTYNVQTTRNPPVFSGTRSSTRTRTRTPSSFRCVASIEIERSPSPSRARQYDFEELETKRKTLLLSPDFLRNFLSNFNAYIYIFIN